jgi:Zn-dependent M28 family amino/carboxypeptidase
MSKYFTFISLIIFVLVSGCYQKNNIAFREDGLNSFSAERLKQNIAVLAADSLTGRKPFTPGETKTINYIRQQFLAAGLEPGNGNSFLQEVPMVSILATAAPSMKVRSSKGDFKLKAFDDYIIWTDKTDEFISLDNAELVFAGYGVVAPEYNWNDYEGLDVKNKVVLVLVNDPGFWIGDTTLFQGKRMTYWGRWTYKFEEAARQGAKGCLIIHNTAAAGYPFSVPQNNFNTSRLQLDKRGQDVKNCDVVGWLTETVAKKLFLAAGLDSSLIIKANQRDFKGVPMNLRLSTTMEVQVTYNKSYNVVGKITGTGKKDEVIIYTAHWDHLGIGKPDETGDSIYNGALDNATAVAGLFELARAFKSMKTKPERSVIFLAVTAEEQGLLGSEYFVENPVFPLNKIAANINMECLNWGTKTNDMVIIGEGQSELEDYFREEVEKTGGYISAERHPEAGGYYRSDHFSFVKAGVPALYVSTGCDVVGKGKEAGAKIQDEYIQKVYHRPSDEYNPLTWTMDGAINELKLLFQVGKRVAYEEKRPEWKPGSEYKIISEKLK